jgi:Glyoxalase/Bleomycin resistance protein/Dioxygenase superfamily
MHQCHAETKEAPMSRIQLALNVENLEESIGFYSKLFATEPAKVRPGYANFAVTEPPLKLVLIENPGQGGSINHLGIEVTDAGTVDAEQTRLAQAGFDSVDERGTTCCYAEQDKFWVENAPNGERWEVYTVLADSPVAGGPNEASACSCGTATASPEVGGLDEVGGLVIVGQSGCC